MVWRFLRLMYRQTQPEIPLIASFASVRTYKQKAVQYLLQEPFSFGPVHGVAGAVWTEGRPTEDRHGPLLPFWPGSLLYT